MKKVISFIVLLLAMAGMAALLVSLRTAGVTTPPRVYAAEPIFIPLGDSAEYPVCVDFEAGLLPTFMFSETIDSPPANGRVWVQNPYPGPQNYRLDIDTDCMGCGGDTIQGAVLSVDLANRRHILLEFWAWEHMDDEHPEDGVFISDDGGQTWAKIFNLNELPPYETWVSLDLDPLVADAGMSLVDGFLIKFQSRDNYSDPEDGYSFDDICLGPIGARTRLDKTAGLLPSQCATQDTITVGVGSDVTYCYRLVNTGSVTITHHDLEDSELGVLLDDEPLFLPPDTAEELRVTMPITASIVNTAIWTGRNPTTGDVVTSTDSATVNTIPAAAFPSCFDFEDGVLPESMFTMIENQLPAVGGVYIGGSPAPGGGSRSLNLATISPEEDLFTTEAAVLLMNLAGLDDVWLDFWVHSWSANNDQEDGVFISNDGGETWTLIVSLQDFPREYQRVRLDLAQAAAAAGVDLTENFYLKFQARTRYQVADDGFSFDLLCVRPAEAQLAMDATIGLGEACGVGQELYAINGTQVTICYTATNQGELPFTNHDLVDSVWGPLLTDYSHTLGMEESLTVSRTVILSATQIHSATWTARNPGRPVAVSETDVLPVYLVESAEIPACLDFEDEVLPGTVYTNTLDAPPAIGRVRITDAFPWQGQFGLDLDTSCNNCGGETTSMLTLVVDLAGRDAAWLDWWAFRHDLDSRPVQIWASDDFGLHWTSISAPVQRLQRYENEYVDLVAAANQYGLDLVDGFQVRLQTTSTRSVPDDGQSLDDICVTPVLAQIQVEKTVGRDPAECALENYLVVDEDEFPLPVTYCYQVKNTGMVTFSTHHVVDDQLGVLWDGVERILPPGETIWFTKTTTISSFVLNEVTWTATVADGGLVKREWDAAQILPEPTDVNLSGFNIQKGMMSRPVWMALLLVLVMGGIYAMNRRKKAQSNLPEVKPPGGS